MANIGKATLEITADTTKFNEQMDQVEARLNGIPTRAMGRFCFSPWALVRVGWYVGIGLSLWYALVTFVWWLLDVIFGTNVASSLFS